MKLAKLGILFSILSVSASAQAAPYLFTEAPSYVRFEQYTAGSLYLWRLPSPGTSTFPGGTCKYLTIPGTVEKTSRFMALYMFAKSNGLNYFAQYDTSNCQMISFGLDG